MHLSVGLRESALSRLVERLVACSALLNRHVLFTVSLHEVTLRLITVAVGSECRALAIFLGAKVLVHVLCNILLDTLISTVFLLSNIETTE